MTNSSRWSWSAPPQRPLGSQPSKAARRRVKEAFDADVLIDMCQRQDFSQWAERKELAPGADGRDRFYWYKDNGSPILFVAHLDTVQANPFCGVYPTGAGLLACSGALDDRLGVYVGLDLLPKLGINVDILLTTDEERGASTARAFDTDVTYNWMIEFDRGGTDVVMYQYETDAYADLVAEAGARMDIGSYSDIADLDHLGCAGFNWGVGYQDYHSAKGHAWLEDTFRMVARFEKFWTANKDTRLSWSYADEDRWDDDENWIVADCGHEIDAANPDTYVEIVGGRLDCTLCSGLPEAV